VSLAPAACCARMVPVARTVKFHVKRPLRAQPQVTLKEETHRERRQAASGSNLLRRASRKTMPGSYPGMPRCGGPRSEDRIVQRQKDVLKRRLDRLLRKGAFGHSLLRDLFAALGHCKVGTAL
jgi:hypothetical protein